MAFGHWWQAPRSGWRGTDQRARVRCLSVLAGAVVGSHRRYMEEELLWPADAIAGVHGATLVGRHRPGLTDVLPAGFTEGVWRGALRNA